jgi:hypothetical protein
MNTNFRKYACAAMLGAMLLLPPSANAQTPGSVNLTATINDLGAKSGSVHFAVVWVTGPSGFIKTLWKQGPKDSFTGRWTEVHSGISHVKAWNDARAGSTALDGYTTATAQNYTAVTPPSPGNNPIYVNWNCLAADNVTVVPDGTYNFFIQYAEDIAGIQGPVTTALTWTKGAAKNVPETTTFANQGNTSTPAGGSNFTNITVKWAPAIPEIAVEQPVGTNLVDASVTPINCGSANVGSSASAVTFTVKNTGTAALTLTNPVGKDGTNAADFAVSSIVTSVAATSSTTFTVTFTPSAVGTRTAALHIASNDADETPFDINLTGTGVAAPEIAVEQPVGTGLTDGSVTPINFGSINLGSSSSAFTFTVKNIGTAALTLTNPVGKDGTNAADFAVSSIATSVAAGGSTTFTVTFTPGAAGTRTAALHIASNDTNENPFDINLTGAGGAVPEITVEQPAGTDLIDGSASINCGSANVGTPTGPVTFTVKNTGTAALTLTNPVGKDGANAADFAVSSIATSVAAGGSTTFTVTFTPGAAGARTAAIHIASNDSNENPFDITLTGTGLVPEIAVEQPGGNNLTDGSATPINFGTVNLGQSSSAFTFTVKNLGTAALTLTNPVGKNGTNAADFTVSSIATSVAAGSSTIFTVTFTPSAVGTRTAALHLASNDADENPFDINLTGTAENPVYTLGTANFKATLHDFTVTDNLDPNTSDHIAVAWVTKADGTFIKTLWKQGPDDFNDAHYNDHCTTWNAARAGSTVIDGFTTATATSYSAPNSPMDLTWNCRDADNNPVPDGNYIVKIQYTERMNPGVEAPIASLPWTKGTTAFSNTYANSGTNGTPEGGSNYTAQSVAWTPLATPGSVNLKATLHDLTATGYPLEPAAGHIAVAWVTKADGTFIKTLWKQGPDDLGDSKYDEHFTTWNAARGINNVIDGFSGATASTYLAPNSPIDLTWNCKDSANKVVPDGDYKLWIQYLERMAPGIEAPVSSLLWTKGAVSSTNSYSNSGTVGGPEGGSNYTAQSVVWTPQATAGSANVKATLHDFAVTDYPLENTATHMAVAWVTKADGTFIKTLWKQGPVDFADQRLADHFRAWDAARNGSTVIDGYSGATATTYAAPNSPLDITWNGKDAGNNLMPDGDYKFWIQYSERMAPGVDAPVSGLAWTKGPASSAVNYTNEGYRGEPVGGFNFTAQSVSWSLSSPFDDWIAGQVAVGQTGPLQTPKNDGVTNLEKFAFNMNAAASDVRRLTVGAGGTAGLPGGAVVGGKLRIEFLRRKASSNPGITYKPQFSSSLGAWVDFTGTETVGTAPDPFERVTVEDPIGGTVRFGRVKVVKSP